MEAVGFVAACAFVFVFELTNFLASGAHYCTDSMDCVMLAGYTCHNSQCICEPIRELGLFPCSVTVRTYGDRCRVDQDCTSGDINLICARAETKTCRCRRGLVWDIVSKRCYLIDDETTYGSKFDPIQNIIIPGIIILTIGAMVYLSFKLFCNCGKVWRRRRRGTGFGRDIEESFPTQSATTWVASYRVFSSAPVETRSTPFPTCLLVPAGPPTYEEALKHKVILSSYYPSSQANNQPQVSL